MWRQVRLTRSISRRQNTFFVTSSGVQNRLQTDRQPRTLVTNSYIEGDSGYGFPDAAPWCSITPTSGRQLHAHSRKPTSSRRRCPIFTMAFGDQQPLLTPPAMALRSGLAGCRRQRQRSGRDRDGVINEGFNVCQTVGRRGASQTSFAGNTGTVDDKTRSR